MADEHAPDNNVRITARVNSVETERVVPTRTLLADYLRDDLGLKGTKVSCGMQVCGTCSVLVDGRPVSSCTYLAADIVGTEVTTVEGLTPQGDALSHLQAAFVDHFALQCGFCTPGFLVMATALLQENVDPTPEEISEYLEGNICRCTGYEPIIAAVRDAADRIRQEPK